MDISTLKHQIQANAINPFYIFTGNEFEVQWIYIKQMAKQKGQEVKYIDNFASIYAKLKSKSLLSKDYCYVLRDDKDIMTTEKLWAELGGVDLPFSILKNNTLILLVTDLDKRTKFYKYFKDDIVVFEPLPEQMLIRYIQKEVDLSVKNCQKLIEVCEGNYDRILLEIDKVKRYVGYLGPAPMFDGVFAKLLKDGTIYQPPKDAIFDFVDAVLRRDEQRAFMLLQESYASGEATLVLLQVLYNNVKQMLQVQSCTSSDIPKSTGLTAWQVKCAKERIGKWKVGELVHLLKDIRNAEVGIKTGEMEDDVAVNYVLVKNL